MGTGSRRTGTGSLEMASVGKRALDQSWHHWKKFGRMLNKACHSEHHFVSRTTYQTCGSLHTFESKVGDHKVNLRPLHFAVCEVAYCQNVNDPEAPGNRWDNCLLS